MRRVPIPVPDESRELHAAAFAANQRGVLLHEQGRIEEAIVEFRAGIAAAPELAELHTNLGSSLSRLGRFDEARQAYEQVLRIDPSDLRAHLAMYELEQIAGNPEKAVAHQARVLERQTLFSEIAPREARKLLVLMAPGDWQANVPVDFLVDRETTTLHKLFLTSPKPFPISGIPAADVVLTGIAESDANAELLRTAQQIVDALRLPVINAPERVLGTSRTRVWEALHDLPGVVVPRTVRIGRGALAAGACPSDFPIVVRPVGSHAGHGLERVADDRGLQEYVASSPAAEFFVMPFVDFSLADGYFRKYRIIVVDGVPYAYHLAISDRWMIHYYNALMREHAWMRQEEERFLTYFEEVFDPKLQQALRDIAGTLQLEYFGIDCSIDRNGRLILFEADPAMIVHAGDDPVMFGYKIPAARRIFAAFERLVDRARSR